jgi:Regulator of ribonuclease activity B
MRRMTLRSRRAVSIALLTLAAWGACAAAPGPTASRGELKRWLAELRASGVADVDRPVDWRYAFMDRESRRLEALSLTLVREGYRIVALEPSPAGATLRVARLELHTPATLERRNAELAALARTHGVAGYVGPSAPPR